MAAPIWDYSAIHGQHKWSEHCKIGNHQSPIDIIHKNTTFDDHLQANPLKLEQHAPISVTVLNKGVNISFSPKAAEDGSLPEMSNGALENKYVFKECHFHWGRDMKPGSEHLVDGLQTEAELHLVHQRKNEASPLECSNGLSVLGIRLIISDNEADTHPVLKSLLSLLPKVAYKNEEAKPEKEIDLYSLLDSIRLKYYTYDGSLTTPPLAECVKWIVFSEPLKICKSDYEAFACVYPIKRDTKMEEYYDPFSRSGNCSCVDVPTIGDNYREICNLNGRKVNRSFK